METDAIRVLIQAVEEHAHWVASSCVGKARTALAALEAQALCALSESDDPRAQCILVERLEAEREALRKALLAIVDSGIFLDHCDALSGELERTARATLASVLSDKVLVPKNKLRKVLARANSLISALLYHHTTLEAEKQEMSDVIAELRSFASLIGEEGGSKPLVIVARPCDTEDAVRLLEANTPATG